VPAGTFHLDAKDMRTPGSASRLAIQWFGGRQHGRRLVVGLRSTTQLRRVTVEARRGGRLYARSRAISVSSQRRKVALRRRRARRFPKGRYAIVIRRPGAILARRTVTTRWAVTARASNRRTEVSRS
jgi:hypothetical protein